jgi:uncharacterized coiled-coil DUF342 family protein
MSKLEHAKRVRDVLRTHLAEMRKISDDADAAVDAAGQALRKSNNARDTADEVSAEALQNWQNASDALDRAELTLTKIEKGNR